MRCQEESWSIESGLEKGREPPDWFLDGPFLEESDRVFVDAFWRLSTERPVGMALGVIPWMAMMRYAQWLGLVGEASEVFVEVMEAMDRTYMDIQAERRQKKTSSTTG